jgi:pyridoxamine 5'-phosphate oxidase
MKTSPTPEPLRPEHLAPHPIAQFKLWLEEAANGGVSQPLAATLATVGHDGQPLARTVLLKFVDEAGPVFFTHLGSRKVRQMAENPRASLLFPWLVQQRQVGFAGTARRLGTFEALKCFLMGESGGVSARAAVEMQLAELKRKLGTDGKTPALPLGPAWGGFRIEPESVEFFQGRGGREHDRYLYRRETAGGWGCEPLV